MPPVNPRMTASHRKLDVSWLTRVLNSSARKINFHSQAFQILTDNGGDVDTLGTARAGAKAEFHAVAPRVFNNAVPISVHKTGSLKDRPGLIQVIIIFNDIRVIEETVAWTH